MLCAGEVGDDLGGGPLGADEPRRLTGPHRLRVQPGAGLGELGLATVPRGGELVADGTARLRESIVDEQDQVVEPNVGRLGR